MSVWHGNSRKRKLTGGRKRASRVKRNYEKGAFPAETTLGEPKRRCARGQGGNIKVKALSDKYASVTDPKSGKTEKNFSTCQLIIDIERLPPGGIFSGTIFIDPQYTPKTNEVLVFCDDKIAQRSGEFNLSQNLTISAWVKYSGGVKYKYHGNYFFEQLGWVHNRSIEGEINMSGDAWINKGIYLRNMGLNYNFQPTEDVKNSIDSFNNAIKIDENSSIAWNEKGISLAYLGNFSGAFQSFDRSISINPNFDKPYYHIALMYLKIGNCGIATNYAKKALKINPDSINSSRLIESCSNINIVAPEIIRNVWSAPLKVDR